MTVVAGLLGAAAALLGAAAGLVAHAAGTGGALGPPLCVLVVAFCCARAAGRWTGVRATIVRAPGPPPVRRRRTPPVRHVVDRAVRLGVAFVVHPALPLALLPLCRTVPAPAVPALSGPDADAARAVRRVVRTATEDAWTGPSGAVLVPLLLRRHTEFSARVATATARAARRATADGVRARLPVLYALVLSATVLALAGPVQAGPGEAVTALTVFVTVVTTPLSRDDEREKPDA
ncbi:hypothetical protein ACFVGY_06290 [Streptomyces sp. NPDC127106]|uniref:hypothetical protein n=1 Tax=Streptomyces sp. NPDC127106 TaxID=3345360 RepID=UPI0036279AC0